MSQKKIKVYLKLRRHGAARPERPKFEARRAEAGVRFLGRGQLAPLPASCKVWESGLSSPGAVWGKAPAKVDFCVFNLTESI